MISIVAMYVFVFREPGKESFISVKRDLDSPRLPFPLPPLPTQFTSPFTDETAKRCNKILKGTRRVE